MCNFSRIVLFYHGANFVQKFGLDSRGWQSEKTEEIFEIGG